MILGMMVSRILRAAHPTTLVGWKFQSTAWCPMSTKHWQMTQCGMLSVLGPTRKFGNGEISDRDAANAGNLTSSQS